MRQGHDTGEHDTGPMSARRQCRRDNLRPPARIGVYDGTLRGPAGPGRFSIGV